MFKTMATCIILNLIYVSTFLFLSFFDVKEVCFRENCNEKKDEFLKRCFYHSGQYNSEDNFAELDKKLKEHEVT